MTCNKKPVPEPPDFSAEKPVPEPVLKNPSGTALERLPVGWPAGEVVNTLGEIWFPNQPAPPVQMITTQFNTEPEPELFFSNAAYK